MREQTLAYACVQELVQATLCFLPELITLNTKTFPPRHLSKLEVLKGFSSFARLAALMIHRGSPVVRRDT